MTIPNANHIIVNGTVRPVELVTDATRLLHTIVLPMLGEEAISTDVGTNERCVAHAFDVLAGNFTGCVHNFTVCA